MPGGSAGSKSLCDRGGDRGAQDGDRDREPWWNDRGRDPTRRKFTWWRQSYMLVEERWRRNVERAPAGRGARRRKKTIMVETPSTRSWWRLMTVTGDLRGESTTATSECGKMIATQRCGRTFTSKDQCGEGPQHQKQRWAGAQECYGANVNESQVSLGDDTRQRYDRSVAALLRNSFGADAPREVVVRERRDTS